MHELLDLARYLNAAFNYCGMHGVTASGCWKAAKRQIRVQENFPSALCTKEMETNMLPENIIFLVLHCYEFIMASGR